MRGEKKRKVRRRISLPASRRPRMCDTSFEETPGVLCLSRRILSFRFLVSLDVFDGMRPRENEEMQSNLESILGSDGFFAKEYYFNERNKGVFLKRQIF